MHRFVAALAVIVFAGMGGAQSPAPAVTAAPTMADFLSYPFIAQLVAAPHGDRIAWIENVNGVRNVYVAAGPDYAAHPVTSYTADDGQELTQLQFNEAGDALVYVRGGDHDANWPAEGDLAPDPASDPDQPKIEIWTVPAAGGEPPRKLAEGDEPAISAQGRIAFVKDHQVWQMALSGGAAPERAAFDRGKAHHPIWSPDGARLAFVSDRGDHSFIAVIAGAGKPLVYLAPSTGRDGDPVWSPDSQHIAFSRQPGEGGAPEPLLQQVPHPLALWTADAATGTGQRVWQSPLTLDGSYPQDGDGLALNWLAGDKLAFIATLDGWEHLYALPAGGGQPALLTPGNYMVEHVALAHDRGMLLYAANTGNGTDDGDRRHIFSVSNDGAAPKMLATGDGMAWSPVAAGDGVAAIAADAQNPPGVALLNGDTLRPLHPGNPAYPASLLVTPSRVRFTAPDGLAIEGQVFAPPGDATTKHPAVVFVHGGPPRQMLLGWHYMDYYSNAYAVNQYLASQGFIVLAVNYRLGIGYGRAFEQPDHAGPAGGAEYQDVLAGARYLQTLPAVDPGRIGIWGGSYGGYLTAMALAHNSDVFKAGVDLHGVHDWSQDMTEFLSPPIKRYEQGDWLAFLKTAFESSPDSAIATWKSPVLLIQGDDDRNVRFHQTVDLAARLSQAGVPYEELVFPNEIHGFLRHDSWLKADMATVAFLKEKLGAGSSSP